MIVSLSLLLYLQTQVGVCESLRVLLSPVSPVSLKIVIFRFGLTCSCMNNLSRGGLVIELFFLAVAFFLGLGMGEAVLKEVNDSYVTPVSVVHELELFLRVSLSSCGRDDMFQSATMTDMAQSTQ